MTIKLHLPACSSLVFLGFQLTDFDKTVSFGRYSAYHGYFVVSSPYERFRILLPILLPFEHCVLRELMRTSLLIRNCLREENAANLHRQTATH